MTNAQVRDAGERFALSLPGVVAYTGAGFRFDCLWNGLPVEVKTTRGRGFNESRSDYVDALIAAGGYYLFVWVDEHGEVDAHLFVSAQDHPRRPKHYIEKIHFPSKPSPK